MDLTQPGKSRYSLVAMAFHWTIAVLVILNWRLADMAHEIKGPEGGALMGDHKAFGMLILALTLGRLLWRLAHPVPRLPANYARWEVVLARATHVIFYVLLIALPLGAWIATSLAGRPIDFFGLFTIPTLPIGLNKGLSHEIFDLHGTFGMILIYLVGLHILGALKHTFIDKDGGIFRMLPFGRVAGER